MANLQPSLNKGNNTTINSISDKADLKVADLPAIVYFLFYFFGAYMVLPVIDVPLLGLSLSAPVMFLIAVPCIFKPPKPWAKAYQKWIFLALFFWLGIFISAVANGISGINQRFGYEDIALLIQFVYWLIAFVITTYVASQKDVLHKMSRVLGWMVMLLAILRWGEAIITGNIVGVDIRTVVLNRNTYGIMFSTFSPFLLLLIFESKRLKRLIALGGYFLLIGAAAINGSRGSWISIAVGLGISLIIFLFFKPKRAFGLIIILTVAALGLTLILSSSPQISSAIQARFSTLESLEEDKNYTFRELMVQKGLRLFKESPIIGVGPGRFEETYTELDVPDLFGYVPNYDRYLGKSAHNSYMNILAELGLVGLIPYLCILLSLVIGNFWAAGRSVRKMDLLPMAVFLSLIQMSVHFWVLSSITNTATWFIYGLSASVIILNKNKEN